MATANSANSQSAITSQKCGHRGRPQGLRVPFGKGPFRVHLNLQACIHLHPLLCATHILNSNQQPRTHPALFFVDNLFHLDVRHSMEENIHCYFNSIATLNSCTCFVHKSFKTKMWLNERKVFLIHSHNLEIAGTLSVHIANA